MNINAWTERWAYEKSNQFFFTDTLIYLGKCQKSSILDIFQSQEQWNAYLFLTGRWTNSNVQIEVLGIDPRTSRMLSKRSTIWATPPWLDDALHLTGRWTKPKIQLEVLGIDPSTSRMLSERSTIMLCIWQTGKLNQKFYWRSRLEYTCTYGIFVNLNASVTFIIQMQRGSYF